MFFFWNEFFFFSLFKNRTKEYGAFHLWFNCLSKIFVTKSQWVFWYSFLVIKQLDRFIPNRSAMDMDYAHYMLTEGRKDKENPAVSSPSREAYRKQLAETFNMNRTRILAFKNKPPTPVEVIPTNSSSSVQQAKPKTRRYIPQVH